MAITKHHILILSVAIGLAASTAGAKDKHSEPPRDQIAVLAHIPLAGGAVNRFVSTEHYRKIYLYAERQAGEAMSLIDVTRASQPAVLAEIVNPPAAGPGRQQLTAVAGEAALVAVSNEAGPVAKAQTFRIVDYSDAQHPTVKQTFDNVTAIAKDEKRGLIFLANADGLWVLQEKPAMDPEFEKEWEHMMLDNR